MGGIAGGLLGLTEPELGLGELSQLGLLLLLVRVFGFCGSDDARRPCAPGPERCRREVKQR